jgi:hypothetical protein
MGHVHPRAFLQLHFGSDLFTPPTKPSPKPPAPSSSLYHCIAVVATMAGPKTAPRLYCNMCSDHFATRDALLQHMAGHREPTPEERVCETCKWSFDDTVALEKHHMISGHGVPPFPCDNCDELFLSDAALSHHRKSCRGKPVHCDSCHVQFSSEVAYNKHRRFPSHCADNFTKPFKAKEGLTKPALKIDTAPQHGGVLRYEVRDSTLPVDRLLDVGP